ncbi:MAG TPA: glycosyltransferase family 9 protein [Gemmataceae bacterium]
MKTASLRSKSFRRILLVKPSAVGDVIHTLPVLAKLRARYPDAQIDWLLTPAIAELVRHHPDLSGVVLFDRHGYTRIWRDWSAATELADLFATIRRARYDLVVDLHGQFRTAVLTLASGAPVRVGFDRPRRSCRSPRPLPASAYRHGWVGAREGAWVAYTHRIRLPSLDVHAVDRYLLLGPMLGLGDGPPEFRVPVPAAADLRVDQLLAARGLLGRPLAVLVPGTLWETKHWHADGFARTARHLLASGRAVVLAGAAAERPRCREVADRCPGACDLSGQTALTELAALLRRAAVCVTNDSGSMHLAVALGRPVVSVFGPTDPVWIGPYGRPHAVVRADLPCAPCYLRKLSRCPHAHACMEQVRAEDMIDRVERVIAAEVRAA